MIVSNTDSCSEGRHAVISKTEEEKMPLKQQAQRRTWRQNIPNLKKKQNPLKCNLCFYQDTVGK